MASSSSSSWMITGCGSSRATGWKERCQTSRATKLYAMPLRRDSERKILKAALLLESISSLKQFAESTREAEKRCAKAGAVRVVRRGCWFSFSFLSYFCWQCAPRVVWAVTVIPAVVVRSFLGIGAAEVDGRPAAAGSVDSVVVAGPAEAAEQAAVGNKMRTHHFLRRLDHNRVTQAIKKAEGKSSGQIRVFIQRGKFEDDALPRAGRRFLQLGMQKTRDRNAVLIFVAPRAHKYAVVGDVGVHEKCGEEFWKKLVHDMRAHFKNQDFNRAIVLAISEVGKLLAAHFPRTGDTINELPDEIAQG